MADPQERPWTLDEFFAWQERQAERYELVAGRPLRMMAGAKNVQDDIVVNVIAELRSQLRGSGCRPFTGDGSVETSPGQIRRPDVGVDCGRRDPQGYKAEAPRLALEVLSPSTRDFDSIGKLHEYRSVEGLDYIVVVEPNEANVRVQARDVGGVWREQRVTDLAAKIEFPSLGVALPMSAIYEGVVFPAETRFGVLDPPV